MEERRSFTAEELALAKSVDLTTVAASLGYTVKKIGRYHAQIQNNLLAQLSEKDGTLEKQQNELNEARVEIARLHREIEEIRKERKALEEQIKKGGREEPESKKPEKEKEPEEQAEGSAPATPETALYPGIEYRAAVVDKDGNIVRFVPVERMERKDRGSVIPRRTIR